MNTARIAARLNGVLRRTAPLVAATCLLAAGDGALAQRQQRLPQTTLNALSPCGGKAGTTFDVKVSSGTNLDDLTALHFNKPGLKARRKMQKSGGKMVPVANTFVVTIDAAVPSGLYEARVAGDYGMSNPRTFVVGRLDEIAEKAPNNTEETAAKVGINQTVNAAIGSTAEIDYFRFHGKAGQRVTVDCQAARIDSQLRAAIELFAPDGQRIAFSRNDVRDDPVITLRLPASGSYLVKLYDFTYRGGADYFYRLSVHTAPRVDFVLPTSGVSGTTGRFTLYGRNLPGGQPTPFKVEGKPLEKVDVQIALPKEPHLELAENLAPCEAGIDAITYIWKSPAGESNPVLIHLASAPATLEKEPNDDGKTAQKITVPAEISGQFQNRGDVDYYQFDAKAKDVFYVEVFSQRLGTSADPYLKIERVKKDKSGKETVSTITATDDTNFNTRRATEFNVSTDDPLYRFQVPSDGTYRVSVRDRYFEARGGPRLVYRLSIRRPEPDFRVVVLPITPGQNSNQPGRAGVLALRKGENLPARVIVLRRDGFDGAVELSVDGLPKGVECKGGLVGPGQSSGYLVFSSEEKAAPWSGLIRVTAKARVKDAAKVAAVTAAEKALNSAEDALPALRKAAQTAEDAWKKAKDAHGKALAAAKKDPKNKGLESQAKARQKAADVAKMKRDDAKKKLDAGEKRLAEAQAVVKKAVAEEAAAEKTIARGVRPATIAWNGQQNITAGVARVARSLGLSVLDESAPIQLTTDVFRVEANQGRQILVPTKLARRNGFKSAVNVQIGGLPRNSGIQIQNKPINQGKNSEVYRFFVGNNAKPGVYTAFLRSTARVSYRKGLEKLELAKKEQAAATKAAQAADKKAKDAAKALADATKNAAENAAKLKTATTAQAAAQKNATVAQTAAKQAAAEKAKADKGLADAVAAVKAATAKLDAAKKAAAASPKDKKLADATAAAQKALTAAQQAQTAAQNAKNAAEQKAKAADDAAKKANDALTAANKAVASSQAAAKVSEAAKAKAAAASKPAAAASKAAAAAKKAADQKFNAANTKARPQQMNIFPISTPVIIEVKQAPGQLSASVQSGGNLKRGGKLTIKTTIRRMNGFKGPVTLSLPLPPGVVGVTAPEVTIPAGKNDGVLTVQAAGNATLGQLANMVVRGTMQFNGKAAIDAAVTIRVSK
jgi:hypothetical protein